MWLILRSICLYSLSHTISYSWRLPWRSQRSVSRHHDVSLPAELHQLSFLEIKVQLVLQVCWRNPGHVQYPADLTGIEVGHADRPGEPGINLPFHFLKEAPSNISQMWFVLHVTFHIAMRSVLVSRSAVPSSFFGNRTSSTSLKPKGAWMRYRST